MKKKLKAILTSLLAFAMVLSGMAIPSINAQAVAEETAEATTAYLTFADTAWTVQYWNDGKDYAPVVSNAAEVTGYGQYTVSLDFTGVDGGVSPDMGFMDVEIANGESLYPNSFMTIDSVKINGEEVTLGKTYTSSDDKIATRTNLFNTWVSEITGGRTVDGDNTDITATPVAGADIKNIETVEVTFTLGDGVAFGDALEAAGPVQAKELPAEGTTGYITMADNAWGVQYWNDGKDYSPVVVTPATITGYGQYTTSIDFSGVDGGVCPDMVFMDVEVDDGELYFPNSYMQIDSVKINGEEVTLAGNTYTSSDNKEDTRVNLFNTWVTEITEGRTNGLDFSEVTAAPVDGTQFKDIKTVEVTFTLIEGEAVATEEAPVEIPSEFNAFMMFSDVSGAWECYEPGKSGDAKILGDGEYTVYLKASDIGATGQATEGQVFVVDIEDLGTAMVAAGTLREDADGALTVTDAKAKVKVFVDGVEVITKSDNIIMGDLEGNGRLRLELYNVWGSGTADMPVVAGTALTPKDEIKVVFTLEGTGYNTGATVSEDTAAPAAEVAVVEETEDSGMSTGLIVGIVAAVVVVAGAACVVVMKKKKGTK